MVGHEIAKIIEHESEFIGSLAPNFHQLLRNYQVYIIEHDPELAGFLREYSAVVAQKTLSDCQKRYPGESFKMISIMGKVAANDSSMSSEADLVLESQNVQIPISLKISKKGSYLNTKSAGIRSCLEKYFKNPLAQKQLNERQDLEFSKFSRRLEESAGLIPSHDFSSWKQHGLSELPGELKDQQREILNAYYSSLLDCFSQYVLETKKQSKQDFLTATRSLCGFESDKIVQVVMFYSRDKENKYQYNDCEIHHAPSLESIPEIRFDGGNTSIYIQNPEIRLQLRIKPMNVFTTKAIKINSSVRYGLPLD